MKEGDDFPQGDKTLRKEDHQAFLREFLFDIKDGKHHILDVVPKEKTIFPPACKFTCLSGRRAFHRMRLSRGCSRGQRSRRPFSAPRT